MNSSIGVLIFLMLFFASIGMQFTRAKKRQKLVRQFDQALLSKQDLDKWKAVNKSFDFMFKDFRKLQIIKKSKNQFPEDFLVELGRYKLLSKLETVVTVSMLLFGVFGYFIFK